jgi:hypothetical protein
MIRSNVNVCSIESWILTDKLAKYQIVHVVHKTVLFPTGGSVVVLVQFNLLS